MSVSQALQLLYLTVFDLFPRGKQSFDHSGVGAEPPAEVAKSDDDFDVYRKRMMLAYRFRPNPLVSMCVGVGGSMPLPCVN